MPTTEVNGLALPRFVRAILRRNRRVGDAVMLVRDRLRRTPGLRRLVHDPLEVRQMAETVARSRPEDLGRRGTAPRVLMVTYRGWSTHATWDAITAQALRFRG